MVRLSSFTVVSSGASFNSNYCKNKSEYRVARLFVGLLVTAKKRLHFRIQVIDQVIFLNLVLRVEYTSICYFKVLIGLLFLVFIGCCFPRRDDATCIPAGFKKD